MVKPAAHDFAGIGEARLFFISCRVIPVHPQRERAQRQQDYQAFQAGRPRGLLRRRVPGRQQVTAEEEGRQERQKCQSPKPFGI